MDSEEYIKYDKEGVSGLYIVQPVPAKSVCATCMSRRSWYILLLIILIILVVGLIVGLAVGLDQASKHSSSEQNKLGQMCSLSNCDISESLGTKGTMASVIDATPIIINAIKSSSSDVDAFSFKHISPSATINEMKSTSISTEKTGKPVAWSRWLGWLSCSTSCDGGIQTRSRVCNNPGGINEHASCFGKSSQSRNCSEWKCPDCNKKCPGIHQLNSACDACICTEYILSGKVKSLAGKVPLDNATIALSEFPFNILATTNVAGLFRVQGICVSQEDILVTRDGYLPQTVKATRINPTEYTLTVTLPAIVFPEITVHPQDKLRFEGQSVTLCCAAEAKPRPQYEWIINDRAADEYQQDGPDGSQLIIPQVTPNMSGEIKCRAYNDYGAEFSNTATIKVLNLTRDTCNPTPSQKIRSLPPGCIHEKTNSTTVDVGKCGNEKCTGSHLNQTDTCSNNNNNHYCCRAKAVENVRILCASVSYINVTRITSCACEKCSPTITTIRGVATGAPDNTPFKYGYIYARDKQLARTGGKGNFLFDVPTEITRLVVTFKDDDGYNNFYELTKVIPFGVGQETLVNVHMRRRPEPILVNATEGFEIPLGDNSGGGGEQLASVAAISMPPRSLMTESGEVYNGTVKVSIDFVDPRNETQVREADGDFTAISEDGEQQLLETFGVLKIDFQSSEGANLEPNADIDVFFEPAEFNLTREEAEAIKLWYMDEKTARWRIMDSGLKQHESRRSKRSGRLFYFGKIQRDKLYQRAINFDQILREPCVVKIEVKSELNGETAIIIVAVIQNNNYRYYDYRIEANTVKCIQTYCTETQATIQVTVNGEYLIPYKKDIYLTTIEKHNITFHQLRGKSVDRFSNRVTMKKLSKPTTFPSPFYTDLDTCEIDLTNNRFYFETLNTRESFEDTLTIIGRLGGAGYWYSDFPDANLCFVKIKVDNCYDEKAYFHVESFRNDGTSAGYDILSTTKSSSMVCAEYKCPSKTDKLTVVITAISKGNFEQFSTIFKSKINTKYDTSRIEFNPIYRLTDPTIGIYHTISKPISQKNDVKSECLANSATAAIIFSCRYY